MAKLMKIWEAKAAKRAAKATGFTLMAVSLAACQSDDADPVAAPPAVDDTPAATVSGLDFTTDVDVLTGGPGDDTFNARLDGGDQTLNSFDELDGGAGTDTLNVTLNVEEVDLDDAIAPTISNIEIFNIRALADANILFENIEGAEQIWSDRSQADLEVGAVQEAATVGLRNVAGNTTFTVNYDEDVLDSDEFTQSLVVIDSGEDADERATVNVVADGDDEITGLNISATGENFIALGAGFADVEDLTITGSGEMDLDATELASLETVTATGYTGDLTLAIDGGLLVEEAELTINLGAGENTLRLAGIDDDDDINDLIFTDDDLTVTGVSILSFVDDILLGGDATLDLDGIAPSEIVFEDAVNLGTDTLSLDNTAASLSFEFTTLTAGTLDFGGDAETVDVTASGALGAATVIFAGEALEAFTLNTEAAANFNIDATEALVSLTVNAEDDVTTVITGQDDADEDTLTTITLIDASDDGDVDFDVTLTDTTNVVTINATIGEAGEVDIDASGAEFDGAVTINVEFLVDEDGETAGAFAYETDADNGVRETFVFTGDELGTVTIEGFHIDADGTGDKLNLSAFGVTLDDLSIVVNADDDIVITSDEFEGSITLVDTFDADDRALLISDGFIF